MAITKRTFLKPQYFLSNNVPSTTVSTRTLIVAGFHIIDFIRHPSHGEYVCTHPDIFGMPIRYVIALYDKAANKSDILNAKRIAERKGHIFIAVSKKATADCIKWSNFLEILGGAVPSWRALSDSYSDILISSSKNRVPKNSSGEAWQIFEEATADGFEFLFGHRVRRLGGRKRGEDLSDMITQTPDSIILLVEAKATKSRYNIGKPQIRPLIDYVKRQNVRQRGCSVIGSVIVIANEFRQKAKRLNALSGEFLAETRFPLAFLRVDDFLKMICQMKKNPTLRNSLRWSHIFCSGGLIRYNIFCHELKTANEERYSD
jgi:hypothetical protein